MDTKSATHYNSLRKDVFHNGHNGKRYTEEFKRQIIDLYLAGKPIAQLAEEYGLVEQTIYKWKKLYAPSIEIDEEQTVSSKCSSKIKTALLNSIAP